MLRKGQEDVGRDHGVQALQQRDGLIPLAVIQHGADIVWFSAGHEF
jgi:hypothetical protein